MINNYYARSVYEVTGAATVQYVLVSVPTFSRLIIEACAQLSMAANEDFIFEIYEGVTTSNDGTPSTKVFNADRNSAVTPQISIFLAPTITVAGTKIWESRVWAAKQATGFGTELRYDLDLKENTKYSLKITKVNTGTHYVDVDFWWKEHEVGAV